MQNPENQVTDHHRTDTSTLGDWLDLLACPVSHSRFQIGPGEALVSPEGREYLISEGGIPMFAMNFMSQDARIQQSHYDRVAENYVANLGYPHTQEYMRYLDEALLDEIDATRLGIVAEVCCGGGEAFGLLHDKVPRGLGIDISERMLKNARKSLPESRYLFVQGDATSLPIQDNCLDTVIMLGGIHHVPDRKKLFSEIFRTLKPGGQFIWREPVSDFFLWRWLRTVIYRISPALDHTTERPLTYVETAPPLLALGFELKLWKTAGLIGFCLFMNSDVLVFNRVFRHVPGIRAITRASTWLDEKLLRQPWLRMAGLQVIGIAKKPERNS